MLWNCSDSAEQGVAVEEPTIEHKISLCLPSLQRPYFLKFLSNKMDWLSRRWSSTALTFYIRILPIALPPLLSFLTEPFRYL